MEFLPGTIDEKAAAILTTALPPPVLQISVKDDNAEDNVPTREPIDPVQGDATQEEGRKADGRGCAQQ